MNRRIGIRVLFGVAVVLAASLAGPSARAAEPVVASPSAPKSEPAKKSKSAKKPAPPVAPFVPGSWTVVIMPDIQHYSTYCPGLTRLQTQWIVDNKAKYNIVYVLQLGDMTNFNSEKEWERASRGMAILDGIVPYALVPGNHDYSNGSPPRDRLSTRINDYFPPSRFEKWPTFGGTMEPGHIENNYHLFEAGGRRWIIIGLEFGPRDHVLKWADRILQKHADRTAILFTHAYLCYDGTRFDWAVKGMKQTGNPHKYNVPGGVNDGVEMWKKLVRKHANVFLVLNGHVADDGLGFQISRGDHGNLVNEMVVNFQRLPVRGGGWLRLIEFRPDGKTVQAKTYSPFYEEYNTSKDNQFVFTLE